MRWSIKLAAMALFLGAMLNCVIAWGCAWISPPTRVADLSADALPLDAPEWFFLIWQQVGAVRVRSQPFEVEQAGFVAIRHARDQYGQPTVPTWSRVWRSPAKAEEPLLEDARGWPWLSLVAWIRPPDYTQTLETKSRVSWGIVVGSHAQPLMQQGELRVLPLLPLWRGTLANSLLFAILLAFPALSRRYVRWYRGRCLRCGYPVGGAPTCTECGQSVTPQSAA